MARAATTSDAFNAIAEPRRREILMLLAPRERPVGEIVIRLRLGQPSVSKHLKILKEVGLVNARREGRQMLYRTNADAIRPLHDWTKTFEQFWHHQLSRIKQRAESSEDSGRAGYANKNGIHRACRRQALPLALLHPRHAVSVGAAPKRRTPGAAKSKRPTFPLRASAPRR